MIGRRHDLGVTYEKYQFQNTWILWSTEEYWNKQHVLSISFGFLQITVRITKKHLAILGPRKWKSCWSGNKNMDCTGAFFFLLHRKRSTNSYQNMLSMSLAHSMTAGKHRSICFHTGNLIHCYTALFCRNPLVSALDPMHQGNSQPSAAQSRDARPADSLANYTMLIVLW